MNEEVLARQSYIWLLYRFTQYYHVMSKKNDENFWSFSYLLSLTPATTDLEICGPVPYKRGAGALTLTSILSLSLSDV